MIDPYFGADARAFFGVVAAIVSCIAYLPYLRDLTAGTTKPQRSSWLVWTVLSSISFASQVAEGASASLLYAGIQCAGTAFIFAFAIHRGAGHFFRGADAVVLAAAGCGLLAWYFTDSAVWALCISCGISLAGGTVTVAKAYARPETETQSFWTISMVAACFAVASVGAWDVVLLIYPAYLLTLKAAVVLALYLGRRHPAPAVVAA